MDVFVSFRGQTLCMRWLALHKIQLGLITLLSKANVSHVHLTCLTFFELILCLYMLTSQMLATRWNSSRFVEFEFTPLPHTVEHPRLRAGQQPGPLGARPRRCGCHSGWCRDLSEHTEIACSLLLLSIPPSFTSYFPLSSLFFAILLKGKAVLPPLIT